MRLLTDEEVRRGGTRELFYGSDPMEMEDPQTIVPRASSVAAPGGDDVFREREESLISSFNQAQSSGVAPERAREDLRLARGMDVPFFVVNQSDRIRNSALLAEHREAYRPAFAKIARERPATAKFLSDPGNMLLAQNDVERLAEAEGLIDIAKRAHHRGVVETELSQLMGKKAIYGMTDEHVGGRIRELRAELDSLKDGPREGFASWVWSAVNTLPQMERQWLAGGGWGAALGAAAGAASATKYGALVPFPEEVVTVPLAMYYGGRRGYVAGAMKTAFEIETGAAYDEFLAVPGVSDEAARVAAVSVGIINSGIEALEAATLVSGFPGGKAALNKLVGRAAMKEALTDPTVAKALGAFAKRYAKGLTFETAQEMVQEVVNILGGRALKAYVGAEQESFAADAARVAAVGVESFKGFSLISAVGPTTSLARDARRVRHGRSAYRVLTESARAADSLAASDMGPEAAREFTKEVMAGSSAEKVFIPGRTLAELHQSGHIQDYEEFVEETLGVPTEAAYEASELGSYLEVDTDALVFAPEPLRNELLREAKFSPEDLSENERTVVVQELQARREADFQAALIEADELRREDKQGALVRETIAAQMKIAAADYDKANAAQHKEGNGLAAEFAGGDVDRLADTAGRVMEAVSRVSSREWTLAGRKMGPREWLAEQGLSIAFGEAKGGLQQSVWHGSPHKFDELGFEHVGSGEGVHKSAVFDDQTANAPETFYQGAPINPNPVVIDPHLLGEFDVSGKEGVYELKDKMLKWYLSNLQSYDSDKNLKNEPEHHPVLGEIYFSKRGGTETVFHRRDLKKLFLVPYLRELIRTGVVYEEDNANNFEVVKGKKKSGEPDIQAYNYLDNTIRIKMPGDKEARDYNVRIAVELHADGKWHYDISKITDGDLGKPKAKPTGPQNESPSGNLGLDPEGFTGRRAEGVSDKSIASNGERGNLELRQISGRGSRGSIVVGERKVRGKDGTEQILPRFQITLSRDANKSTVFHEFGHLFFYDLSRRAALPEATERTRRDYEVLKDWLGWREDQTSWTTEQHEQFARGFEAYLFEGKAPSVELRQVFRTIRDWMVRVYGELRNLNVELSDEVRGVFDRLLATDAAIEEAKVSMAIEADNDLSLLSPEARDAAGTSRVDAYASAQEDLQSHVLRDVTKRAQSAWKRAFKKLEPEVRRKTAESGVYLHFETMRQAPDLRLSSAEFSQRYGAEALAKLPADVVSDKGLDLDTAAAAMGFSSSDEMAAAFVSARPFEEEARARTDAAVAEKYPEKVMTPENMDRLACEALLKRLDLEENIAKEKAALGAAAEKLGVSVDDVLTKMDQENQAGYLSKASKTRRLIHQFLAEDRQTKKQLEELKQRVEGDGPEKKRFNRYKQAVADLRAGKASALKDAADAAIGQKVYTEAIRPSSYVAAAERYRKRAIRNEVAGNYEDAFCDRELESINMAMAKSAREAADETGAIHKYLLKYANRESKQNFGVAARYLDQIDALLARFDLRKRRWDPVAERPRTVPSLAAFAEELERDGEMLLIPESMLNEGFSVPFAKMTVEEIRDLRDIVKNIEHVGRNENRLYKIKGMENAATAIRIICDRIKKYHKAGTHLVLNPTPDAKLPFKEKSAKGKVAALSSSLTPVEYIMREIDGYEDLGPMREFIYETINNADSEEEIVFKKKFGELHDIFVKYYGKDIKATDESGRRVAFKDYKVTFDDVFLYTDEYDAVKKEYVQTDRPLELTFDEWVAFVLNMGNEGNRQRMENWGFSEADLEKIVNAGTERDLEFVQEVWDYLESFKPMIQETHRILTGTSLRWVEPSPLKTKYGTLRGGTGTLPGGYYPIVTDARYNEKAASRQELESLLDRTRFDHSAAYTKQGFRKGRSERVTGAPPKLDLSVLDNHIANVIHDACFSVALRDVQKVFRSRDVQNAIVNAVGAERKEAVNRWLQDVAAGKRRNAIQLTGMDRTVQGITANVATSTLGGAIVGPAVQVLGYFPLIHRLGFVNFLYGVSRYVRHPADYWHFAVSRSGYLQKNMDSIRDAAIQQTRDVWSYKGRVDSFSAQVKAFSMAAFPLCQNLCNVPGWYMSYEVGMRKYGGDEAKAARYADMAISTTQGGGRLIDQTLAERSSPWNRVVMMFWSWFRVQYGMQNEAFRRVFKERSLAAVVNLGSYVFWGLLAQQFAEAWVRGERPDDEDDDGVLAQFAGDPAGGAWWLAKKAAVGAVSAYPVAGPAAQYFINGGRFRLSPVLSRIESSLRIIKQAGSMADDVYEYGFDGTGWDAEDFYKLANGAAELYSLKNGLPIQRFVKMGEAFLRAAEGYDAAALAWDVVRNRRLGSTEGM